MTRFLAIAGLLCLACMAALASVPASAQTLRFAGVSIDLTPVVTDLFTILAAAVAGLAVWLGKRLATLLHLKISAQTADMLEQAALKSAAFGLGKVQDLIAAKGWDHVEVKNQAVALAIPYFTSRFPGALKAAGVNIADPVALSSTVEGLLERVFPQAVSAAAASPATPPAAGLSPIATAACVLLLIGMGLGLGACTGPQLAAGSAIATAAAPIAADTVIANVSKPQLADLQAMCGKVGISTTAADILLGGGAKATAGNVAAPVKSFCKLVDQGTVPDNADSNSINWGTGLASVIDTIVALSPHL